MSSRNDVLLSDFGIAVVAQSSRYRGSQDIAGTIAYMAPEQIQSHPCPASDQYALGMVVYEWLSGDAPFHGSFTEIAAKQVFVSPPPLREKNPSISPSVEQVVMKALEKDPARRFPDVRAFALALEQASQETRPFSFNSPSILFNELSQSTIVPTLQSPSVGVGMLSLDPTRVEPSASLLV